LDSGELTPLSRAAALQMLAEIEDLKAQVKEL
jgi:hypothetical protein